MIETIAEAASYLLWGEVWFFIFLGCIIGLVFGALPGLSGLTALALALPFTYGWDPMVAFFFFAGMMGSVAFGGSIPAILLNTPGTPPNAATCFDGYPMAQRGEAGKALGISATASGLGAIFGLVVLVILIPLVLPIILAFRPPEVLMMVLFGLTCVAFAAKGNTLKGLIAGGLGVFISLIGFSNVFGVLRFNLGSEYLWDGIELVPFMIGFFAINEMINLSLRGRIITEDRISGNPGSAWDGAKEVFKHKTTFFRSSVIGTIIGIIPGVGGTVSNFLAYISAKQSSKHPETFGTGDPEGVIASEAANDAKDGGALLPTVAFGIPGSAEMAVLLGCFILHGLEPGPMLMREHMDIVFALIFGLVISNILASTCGLLAGNFLAWITTINVSNIIPVVIAVCLSGAFVLRGNIWDVAVCLLAGIFGYALNRFGFPPVCLVIGVVLGYIAEKNFTMSLMMSRGDYSIFFTRPISLILFFLFIAVLALPFILKLRANSRSKIS
ncbi:tripartite tricarboxylate transporter permease [Chloroflexota bacterium]